MDESWACLFGERGKQAYHGAAGAIVSLPALWDASAALLGFFVVIRAMSKISNRELLLSQGLRVVAEHGFNNASVRDIVAAAGVPQGSFTHHFASKEAFGIELLDRYFLKTKTSIVETLLNDARRPLERLNSYLENIKEHLNSDEMRNGCLFGNFIAEGSVQSEPIRARLKEIFAEVRSSFAYCLHAAVDGGDVPANLDCEEVAGYIVSSLQGAILIAKAERNPKPFEAFQRLLFRDTLRMAEVA